MVEIKNLRIWNGGIYADCYKECEERQHFELILDEKTFEIVHPSGRYCDEYVKKATNIIKEIIDSEDEFPKSICSVL